MELKDLTGIETDIQLSKDGHIMIMHDETLNRTTDGNGELRNYTLEELKNMNQFKDLKNIGEYQKKKLKKKLT